LIHVTVLRAAVFAAVFLVLGAMWVPQAAAAFSYDIQVAGDGVTASGSIAFPTDSGMDPFEIALSLDAVLFGNAVTFTEANLLTAGWTGAAPNDLDDLLVDNLALTASVGDTSFLLTDNGPSGGGLGDAVCTVIAGDMIGELCGISSVTWTYTPQPSAPVSEPATGFQLLSGLSAMLAGWRARRVWRACRTPLQRAAVRQ